jgi:biopolymer transport protein ExbD
MSIVTNDTAASGDDTMSAINVTPLIDVMFCLLIIFMVATPLMGKDEIPIEIPYAPGDVISESEFLYSTISVDAKGQVFMGVTPLSSDPATLTTELSANEKLKQDGQAFIQGDENAPYEKILDVMVGLKTAGVRDVGFITTPRPKKKNNKT